MDVRIGYGYDVHAFQPGTELVIGGIRIPFSKALQGHSDADVLLHAITDALLGSLALGDIGTHFPDTDPDYENADSLILLKNVYQLILQGGFALSNLDATVVAEAPKLNPVIPEIREKIAEALDCEKDRISIKATTSEKMGFIGRGEGIAAQAVVLIKKCE